MHRSESLERFLCSSPSYLVRHNGGCGKHLTKLWMMQSMKIASENANESGKLKERQKEVCDDVLKQRMPTTQCIHHSSVLNGGWGMFSGFMQG